MSRAEPDPSPDVADITGQQDPKGPGHVPRAGAGLQRAQAGELRLCRPCCPGIGWVIKSEYPHHGPVAAVGWWGCVGALQGDRVTLHQTGQWL